MELLILGINHKTAPVEMRERLSFSHSESLDANRSLKCEALLAENLILSTCNRVEIYAVSKPDNDSVNSIKDYLARQKGINLLDYKESIYVYKGREAVEHLFKVASGLDSMVIGEMEILGQLKQAYRDAKNSSGTGKVLNRLFEKAFNTAKKIRTETSIGHGAVSLSSAAVRLAKKILGDLSSKKTLIIGAGEIGEQLLRYLKKSGVESIMVANRTLERARELTDRFNAIAVAFKDFREKLKEVDIVITSTGSPHCIIRHDDALWLMPKRKQRPLFIIDLAVPRDVEEEINRLDNIYLYNIDDLEAIVKDNIKLRKGELDNCSEIINTAAARFISWLDAERLTDGR